MQIQINTGHHIDSDQDLNARLSDVVASALDRYSNQITRVEVHVNDVNGDKGGENDLRCMMEARMEHHQPIAVTHQAASVDQAIDGAADKLVRSLETTIGKMRDQRRQAKDPTLGQPMPE